MWGSSRGESPYSLGTQLVEVFCTLDLRHRDVQTWQTRDSLTAVTTEAHCSISLVSEPSSHVPEAGGRRLRRYTII